MADNRQMNQGQQRSGSNNPQGRDLDEDRDLGQRESSMGGRQGQDFDDNEDDLMTDRSEDSAVE